MENIKKIINPSAVFYIIILVVITILIGFASGDNTKKVVKSDEVKTVNQIVIASTTNKIESIISASTTEVKINKNMNETKKIVTIETSLGNIELELYADKAPKTVENFVKLASSGFFENTKFLRVIKGFMIQGGDPYTKGEDTSVYGTGGPGYKFADEPNDLPMVAGMLAMANSGPDTNGSQFFIITAQSTPWLVGHHTVFGKVVAGMDVVTKIENTKTGVNDLPVTPVIVTKMTVK